MTPSNGDWKLEVEIENEIEKLRMEMEIELRVIPKLRGLGKLNSPYGSLFLIFDVLPLQMSLLIQHACFMRSSIYPGRVLHNF